MFRRGPALPANSWSLYIEKQKHLALKNRAKVFTDPEKEQIARPKKANDANAGDGDNTHDEDKRHQRRNPCVGRRQLVDPAEERQIQVQHTPRWAANGIVIQAKTPVAIPTATIIFWSDRASFMAPLPSCSPREILCAYYMGLDLRGHHGATYERSAATTTDDSAGRVRNACARLAGGAGRGPRLPRGRRASLADIGSRGRWAGPKRAKAGRAAASLWHPAAAVWAAQLAGLSLSHRTIPPGVCVAGVLGGDPLSPRATYRRNAFCKLPPLDVTRPPWTKPLCIGDPSWRAANGCDLSSGGPGYRHRPGDIAKSGAHRAKRHG